MEKKTIKNKKDKIKELLESLDIRANNLKFDLSQLFTVYSWIEKDTWPETVIRNDLIYWIGELIDDIKNMEKYASKLKSLVRANGR
jgi:hypothetical protein